MKVTGDWLTRPESQDVCAMLTDAGHSAYFVGGCVRNALLGARVSDIEISTDARPERVVELAREVGFHPVPTGIDHGTITVVANHIPHEITTFRKDVETDGRRAVVAFADTLDEDAHRRDFTMNALYADATGRVTDPVGGLDDLADRYVRFIDDAAQRIREDYLRTLRFFRFNAWYGDVSGGYDADALDAIASNLDGLELLSRERIGAEMLKLLAAPDPVSAVAVMRAVGVLKRILPGADDTALGPLVAIEEIAGLEPDPILRLAALGGEDVAARFRLSRADAKRRSFLVTQAGEQIAPGELGYRHGFEAGVQVLALRAASLGEYLDPNHVEKLQAGSEQVFPISSADLKARFSGPALGKRLRLLEQAWIESGFTLGKDDLLRHD